MTRVQSIPTSVAFLCALLVLGGGLLTTNATAKPQAKKLRTAASKLKIDAKKLARSKVLRRGDFKALGASKVSLGPGSSTTIRSVTSRVFAEQRRLGRDFRQAKKGLLGRVRVVETGIERKDGFELTLTTTAVVTDPKQVAKKVPRWSKLRTKTKRYPSQLNAKQRKAFKQWVQRDLKRLPAAHPLRQAYERGGERGLVDAMAAGKGTFSLSQTVIIPRSIPSLTALMPRSGPRPKRLKPKRRRRRLKKRSVDPMTDELRRLLLGEEAGAEAQGEDAFGFSDAVPERAPIVLGQVRKSGVTGGQLKMLTGFTEGDEWIFRERVGNDYGSFYGRVTAWAAVGLRFPVRFRHEMKPTKMKWTGGVDVDVPFDVSLQAQTFDASPADYRAMGIDRDDVFGGKELVLEAGVEARVIVKVFGRKILDETWSKSYDYGRNFEPGLGSRSVELTRFFIPASVTNTDFSFGPARGSMQLGAKIDARGTVGASLRLKESRRTAASWRPGSDRRRFTHDLVFRSGSTEHTRRAKVSKCRSSCTRKYGYQIFAPTYRATLSMTPVVRLDATADLWVTKLHYRDDFWMPELSFDLHRRTFRAHEGTRSSSVLMRGTKTFTKAGSGL